MKISHLSSLIVAAMALPVASFAADMATVFSLKGQVKVNRGEVETMAAVGNDLPSGTLIQSGGSSSVGVKLPDGTTLYLAANTSVRLRFGEDGKKIEVLLLKGSVAGDFTNGAVRVITSAGSVDLGGSSSKVSFTPKQTGGGVAEVQVAKGVASVSPKGANAPIKVPGGNSISFGDGVSAEPGALTKEQLAVVISASLGDFTAAAAAGGKTATPPDVSGGTGTSAQKNTPDLSVLSPNGEGSTN